jgi:hypothetical protein
MAKTNDSIAYAYAISLKMQELSVQPNNLSHVIGVHCVAHRLNLSVLSSVKNGKFINDINSTLKKLYKFYQYSPKRLRQLKQVAESL